FFPTSRVYLLHDSFPTRRSSDLIFHRQFLNLLNVPVEMQGDAASYIQIVGGFIFTQSIFSTFDQIFRCNGKTKIGMVLALCMNLDRKSTRLNSSHVSISYAVFCL